MDLTKGLKGRLTGQLTGELTGDRPGRAIEAVLFDKDGTLFDFSATWEVFAAALLDRLAEGDPDRLLRGAAALRFDLVTGRFLPDSIGIAGTNREVAEVLAAALEADPDVLELVILREAAQAPLQEAVALVPFLAGLAARDLGLGVMTNDSEAVARRHLETVGVLGMFDFVAGADSGYGAKPAPDPLLAYARALDLAPHRVVMVGDSTHDLRAARAAGMYSAGVLTGMATAEDLAPWADVILPDIGHLTDWLDSLPPR